MSRPLRSALGLVALAYARRGWPVLPLHTPTPRGCSCGRDDCPSVGKHPRTRHGALDATTDDALVRHWWTVWPEANIGLRTGADGAGAFVLDVDPRHSGGTSLAELERQHGPLPPTLRADTGSGGEHVWFALDGRAMGNRTASRPGLDGRGENGYVVAPPSLHPSGRRYAWQPGAGPIARPLAPLPPWLMALVAPGNGQRAMGNGQTRSPVASPLLRPIAHSLLPIAPTERARRYLERIEPAIQGAGGDGHTFRVLARVVRGFDLAEHEAIEALVDWNARCQPPWSSRELRQKVRNAMRYGKEPPGALLSRSAPLPIPHSPLPPRSGS